MALVDAFYADPQEGRMSAKDTLVLAIGTGGGNVVADILRQRKERISSSRDIEFVFADTNDEAFPDYEEEFDLAEGSFFTIGPNLLGGEGAGFDHEAAMAAFEESRDELIALVSRYKAVIIVAAGGKTTGLHSMFPLSEAAWTSGTFVMPLFIKPCMDPGHECDAAQLALFEAEVEKFDQTGIRLGVILNEAAYRGARRKMSRAYRDINTPLVEGIEGVATFLASPKDVDRKDMMRQIVRGPGRYFIGSCAVPSNAEREKLVQVARAACENRFFEFRNDGVPGGALALNIGDADNFEEAALRSGAFAYFNELAEERKKAPPRIIPGSFRDLPEGSPKLFTILAGEPLPDGMQPPELPKFRWATDPQGRLQAQDSAGRAAAQDSSSETAAGSCCGDRGVRTEGGAAEDRGTTRAGRAAAGGTKRAARGGGTSGQNRCVVWCWTKAVTCHRIGRSDGGCRAACRPEDGSEQGRNRTGAVSEGVHRH